MQGKEVSIPGAKVGVKEGGFWNDQHVDGGSNSGRREGTGTKETRDLTLAGRHPQGSSGVQRGGCPRIASQLSER